MHETFFSFLQELNNSSSAGCSGHRQLENEVLRILSKEGFSEEQIYEMPLNKLLDLFYDAYLWTAERILSEATTKTSV
jgi:hypothetical protein